MADNEYTDVPITTLLTRFKESEKYRKKYETPWDENRDMYEGNQWKGIEKVAWFQSEPVYNKIYEFVEIHRAYLADNKWGVDTIPASMPKWLRKEFDKADELIDTQGVVGVDPSVTFIDSVEKVNKLLDFLWVENRMKSKLAEVILYMFLYGTGFLKATFDAEDIGDSGIGQIETKVISPFYIFPDPNATSVHDASFIIEHHPVTFRWILENYPNKAQAVKDAGLGSTTEWNERQGDIGRGPADNTEALRVDVYECWYKDSAINEDEENGETSPKYPNGRMTFMTSTGIVLEDKPNPYGMFPYVRFVEVPRPAEFFGDCTVTRCVGIQKTINSILRTIIDNGLWLVHGIWVADTTSGITPDGLAGYAPRDVIVKNPGTEVRRDSGEPLPAHLFQMLSSMEDAFDRVAGTPDVLRGVVPSRQPVETTRMQSEAADVRTRERQRRVEEALEDLAKLWLDIASEHWSDKRVIRNKRNMGGFEMFEMSKEDLQEWKFDVHVIPGSTSPMDTEQQMETAFQLVERAGVPIPPDYFVELSRLPGLQSSMTDQAANMEQEQVPSGEEAPMETAPEEEMVEMDVSPEEQAMQDFAAMQEQAPPPDAGMLPPEAMMGQPPM